MNRTQAQRVLFEQLKRTVPIEAVIARYGIELSRECAAAPATDPATPRAAPSIPSRSQNSSAPENPTNTGFNS